MPGKKRKAPVTKSRPSSDTAKEEEASPSQAKRAHSESSAAKSVDDKVMAAAVETKKTDDSKNKDAKHEEDDEDDDDPDYDLADYLNGGKGAGEPPAFADMNGDELRGVAKFMGGIISLTEWSENTPSGITPFTGLSDDNVLNPLKTCARMCGLKEADWAPYEK
jgi:hypothetical protein